MARLRGTASSDLSAFCDSFYGQYPDFHYLDADRVLFVHDASGIVAARSTRIMRLLETKRDGEDLTRSQRETLPIFSALFDLGVTHGVIQPGSGVFVVTGDGPDYQNGATIGKVRPDAPGAEWSAVGVQFEKNAVLSREKLVTFMRCRRSP